MKTPKKVRRQLPCDSHIRPWPWQVRTVTTHGGHIITTHATEQLAAGEVRWQERNGRQAEIISASNGV